MTANDDPLATMLGEACQSGPEREPSSLLATAVLLGDPLAALSIQQTAAPLLLALKDDLGDASVDVSKTGAIAIDRTCVVQTVRWLVRRLQTWNALEDPHRHVLAAMLTMTSYFDQHGRFWTNLPLDLVNQELFSSLENFLASLRTAFSVPDSATVPIWERETVERFIVADTQLDWDAIAGFWRQLGGQVFPSLAQAQAIRCLFGHDQLKLISALKDTRQIALAMQAAQSLPIEARLGLALKSGNPYIKFCACYQTVTARGTRLSASENEILAELLAQVAHDVSEWRKWMLVFNRYPISYPAFQVALGISLSVIPARAVVDYVEVIQLSVGDANGRSQVAECLRTFRRVANRERRCFLWAEAFTRWSNWCFDQANRSTSLTDISRNELDYAVVGHVVEGLDPDQIEVATRQIVDKLNALEHARFASYTELTSRWRRLLSQWQIFAHGTSVAGREEEWLLETRRYFPFEPDSNRFALMMYDSLQYTSR